MIKRAVQAALNCLIANRNGKSQLITTNYPGFLTRVIKEVKR